MSDSPSYFKGFCCAVLAALVMTICLIPGFLRVPIGINSFDEPYQMLNGMFPLNAPYSPVSAFLTHWFGEFINWRWLYFRYLALGLNAISILIAGAYLFYKTRKYWFSLIVVALALLTGTIIPNTVNMYGWDDWTQLFMVILIIGMLSFIMRPTSIKIVFIGLLAAIISLTRLPNIIVLPVIVFVISCFIINVDKKDKIKYILIFLTTFVLLVVSIICLIYGSVETYFNILIETPITKHGFKEVGYNTFATTCAVIGYLFIINGIYNLAEARVFRCFKLRYFWLGILTFLFMLAYTNYAENDYYIWTITAVEAVVFYCALITIYYNRKNFRSKFIYAIISVLLLASVPFVGSNLGIVKFLIYPMMCIIGIYAYPYLDKKLSAILIGMIIAMNVLTYYRLHRITFFDAGYSTTDYQFTDGKIEGLYTTSERGEKIKILNDVIEQYNNPKNKIINVRLNEDYLAEFLSESYNEHLGSRFDYPNIHFNQDFIDWTENEIITSDKPVVIIYQKHERFEPTDIPDLPMLQMIQKHLTLAEDIDGFLIYSSPESIKNSK